MRSCYRITAALAASILAASVAFGALGQDAVGAYPHAGVLPDPALTPGAVRTTAMADCRRRLTGSHTNSIT